MQSREKGERIENGRFFDSPGRSTLKLFDTGAVRRRRVSIGGEAFDTHEVAV